MCACLVGWYWRHIHLCGGEREGRDENSTMRVGLGKRLPSNRQPGYGGKEKREGDFFWRPRRKAISHPQRGVASLDKSKKCFEGERSAMKWNEKRHEARRGGKRGEKGISFWSTRKTSLDFTFLRVGGRRSGGGRGGGSFTLVATERGEGGEIASRRLSVFKVRQAAAAAAAAAKEEAKVYLGTTFSHASLPPFLPGGGGDGEKNLLPFPLLFFRVTSR